MLGVNERMDLKLFGHEIIFEVFQRMWSRYLTVTDRQRSALASRGKNSRNCFKIKKLKQEAQLLLW